MDRVTGRYRQFEQAVQRLESGDWSAEEFQEFLLQVHDLLAQKGDACRAFIRETSYHEDALEEVGEGLAGIDLYERGLREMWQYPEDGDPRHLEEGLRALWDGNEKINQAMRLNREAREDLDLSFFI